MRILTKYFKIIISNSPKFWIALVFHYFFFKMPKLQEKNRIFVFSVPTYGNLGDQAIAEAELSFLENEFDEWQIVPIYDYSTRAAIRKLKKKINRNDILMIQGGGNFGSLYPKAERDRNLILMTFKNNKIISFPQSIFYSNDEHGYSLLKSAQNAFSLNKKAVIVARESLSLEKMKEMFSGNSIAYTPDIVLTYKINLETLENLKRHGVLFVLRKDKEKSVSEEFINSFKQKLKNNGYKLKESSTVIKQSGITKRNRLNVLSKKWTEFGKSEVVITDRLHGMLFAYLTRTPCLVMKNNNGKIEYTYKDWLSDINFIHLQSKNEVSDAFNEFKKLTRITPVPLDFTEFFKPLKDIIRNAM